MPDVVSEQLQKARERLLDLNLTNRLLNYRPPKTASVRVIDEKINQVWAYLLKGGAMEFLAREEHELIAEGRLAVSEPEQDEDDEGFTLPEFSSVDTAGGEAKRHKDRYLQTAHEGAHLQTRLLRLYQTAQSVVEETGVNVLFLGAGFVNWCPPDRKDLVKAPIFLIPVTLERTSARQRFTLKNNGDDPVLNPCLLMKFQRDFRIKFMDEPDDWEGFDPDAYLDSVRQAIRQQPKWSITDEIYLGVFSFTKYLMYLDLDQERSALGKNRLIRAMCGDREALAFDPGALPRADEMDRREDQVQVFQVVDADSSQQAAIAAVKAGTSLVIQGPPGTGKSQTITNIIAECLANEKSVLFVSQKKAALEVVQSRLQKVGLNDFCLELHSTKAHRGTMLSELERVLALAPSPRPNGDHKIERFKQLRDKLNAYVRALHEPIGKAGWTPYTAIGRVVTLKKVPHVNGGMPDVDSWTAQDTETFKDLICLLARQLDAVWPPEQHPWKGSRLASLSMQSRQDIGTTLDGLISAFPEVSAAAVELASFLGFPPPTTPQDVKTHMLVGQTVLEAPTVSLTLIDDERWDAITPEIKELLGLVKAYAERHAALQGRYQFPQAEAVDWQPMLQRSLRHPGIERMLIPSFWRDRSQFRKVSDPAYHPNRSQRLEDFKQLAAMQQFRKNIEDRAEKGRRYFGDAWRGAGSSPTELVQVGNWLLKARGLVKKCLLPEPARVLCDAKQDRTALQASIQRGKASLQALDSQFGQLKNLAALQDPGVFSSPLADQPLVALQARLNAMKDGLESLATWSQYQDALQRCENAPVAQWVAKATEAKLEPELHALAFDKQMLMLLLEGAITGREPLRTFSARNHEDLTLEFARLDADVLIENRHRLHTKLAGRRPQNGFEAAKTSQLGIIQSEIRRKRGGRTIRRILKDAGEVVQQVKPCFMMSPLSVAQYLDPEGLRFDVVIFDEASQVEPADALGAVARSEQLVLVGDRKQLPPTDFFSSLSGDDQVPQDGEAALTDMESILDRGEAVLPAIPLRWHYRSRHESLISFSNAEFYNNELVVFPSAHTDRAHLGVSLQYDPTDLYDRAHSRTNRSQAKKIALAAFEHFHKHPDKSLAVAAFSVAQQQAILDEVERLRRSDSTLEELFRTDRPEPFFVKNLETVQGDERDVIFLSVGHGRAVAGERVGGSISNLNGEDGWRRLNVIITRARERYVVFSSILGGDMDLSGTKSRGVHAFKKYLEYAESGKLPVVQTTGGEFGSPFEQAVFDVLTERGVQLDKQVGCVGYAVDLAVLDPLHPGRYLLGIECDGATYHGSATARDRDRLRQQVLESLGWRIHRIWSTDWFLRPQAELQRALDAIEKARTGQLKPRFGEIGATVNRPTVVATEEVTDTVDKLPPVPTQPYKWYEVRAARPSDDFYTDADFKLADLVSKIVEVEGPVHEEEVGRRVAAQYGIGRLGNRVVERITRAVEQALATQKVVRRKEFLWPRGMTQPPLRKRDEPLNRNIDTVPLEEIAVALHALVKAQFGIGVDDLIAQTAKVLGFSPSGSRTKARIDDAITAEKKAGRISFDSEGRFTVGG